MKRWAITILVLTLLLGGCAKAVPPVIEVNEPPAVEQQEKIPAIVSAAAPERDPFRGAEGSKKTGPAGEVATAGRDPFATAQAADLWQTKQGEVVASGRNPFVEGSGKETTPPPAPPEQPPLPDETPVTPGSGVEIEITTTDRCWLDVFVDQERVLRNNVPSDETLHWRGEKEVLLEQVGRPRAVEIKINGRQLGQLSELVKGLQDGPRVVAGVQISLRRTYPGGVLVGLSFNSRE